MEETKYAEARKQEKKINPYDKAGFLSTIFFCWLFPLFYKGFKTDLTEDDLFPPLDAHESSRLGDKLETAWKKEIKCKRNPSLWRALWKVFGKELSLLGIVFIFNEFIVKLAQPLSMSKLLSYYEPGSTTKIEEAYLYASLIVLSALVNVLVGHIYMFHLFHLGMKMRVATCSLIYRKALRLSKSSLAETTIGQMVNLLSNDVSRFDFAVVHIHVLWLAPIETILVMFLMYIYVGPTAITGVFLLLLFIPFQMWMGKKTSTFRLKTAIRTDERIRLMNEIISGIQVIKMYTWEKPFAKLVELSRRKEIQQIRNTSTIRAIMMSFNLFLNRAAIYLCILTYVLTGNMPSSHYVFVVTSFYGILRQLVTMFFPQGVTQLAETNISVRRIQKFLMYEEINVNNKVYGWTTSVDQVNGKVTNQNGSLIIPNNSDKESPGIYLHNTSVKWIQSSTDNTLENIDLEVKSNQLIAVVGPVGSGKTTLLHVILRELPPVNGTVSVNGIISYASQEPWLFGGSIRQNIIFGQEFNFLKYQEVVRVCALERDFTLFPYGDRTIAGERGVTLSGGQRARINLARAVYKDADIYLLDDPLSAVDTHVGKHLFDQCITGYLKNKCVILVTHQLQYLTNVEKIYLLEDGKVEASGSYEELQTSDKEFTKLMTEQNEEEHGDVAFQRQISKAKEEKKEDPETIEPQQEKEGRETGNISWKVYKSYILAGGHWCKSITLFLVFFVAQILASSCDYFVTFWVNMEQIRRENALSSHVQYNSNFTFAEIVNVTSANKTQVFEDMNEESYMSFLTKENCLIVYSCLVGLVIILTVSRSIAFFRFCMTASVQLHNNMFNKIVYATMRFFNTNPSGRILNRFSKDIGSIDEMLPITIVDTVQIGLTVLAITVVVATINPWILIPSAIILVIFYCIRIVFLATSRDIKRLEGITRSPIYSHLAASLYGLTTIRAFGAEEILIDEFDHHQNMYSAAYFMFMGGNRGFGFWLDMHCVIFIAFVTMSLLFIQTEMFGGNVGLAITQCLTLSGMFQWGMRQWSELENQMTSVERVREYVEIQSEMVDEAKIKEPPKDWPENGEIKFDKMCLRYAPDEPYILKNLTFTIKGSEKVGVVGRTGAGKSSLISALFRLTDIDGRILIDNVNTKEIPLHSLRSKISIIPQEPVLFSGTLRKNLDPFDEHNDEVLWNALEDVELKGAVSDLPEGLDSRMSEGGSNFSVGQRQLVCLARAIIGNNKILVLDEATANVDPQTDSLIQATIRTKFAKCTVLTIAHRLHTIMDSDNVLVMDAGTVAEFGHPHILLQNVDGVFYGLVKETGRGMAENLLEIAEESYKINLS